MIGARSGKWNLNLLTVECSKVLRIFTEGWYTWEVTQFVDDLEQKPRLEAQITHIIIVNIAPNI